MMSVSLVLLQLEISGSHPNPKHIEYEAPVHQREEKPEWPVLVTERLLSIHRGRREPHNITITTLTEEDIKVEMMGDEKTNEIVGEVHTGVKSKESTPGPSSSKESTPGADELKRLKPVKDPIHFVAGNSSVEVTNGILHLFKENTKTSLDQGVGRSEMLCMLGVPTFMTIHDLLQFTAPCTSSIQNMRIIRDSNPNQYMVLIKFRTQEDADLFYTSFNGQTFNTIEADICRLVYVARVETTRDSEAGLPIAGYTELPNCPVCLERMDESVDGILTILCNHSFHGACLAKWGDTSCPVCRYCQTPDEIPDQRCFTCGANGSLWICLICGNVGCGRYVGGDAHTHFVETNHLFSLEVGTNRVWDYVRDNYVHRLLQSEGDGKVVSYEPTPPANDGKELDTPGEEKLTSLQLEFTHLLSSQLESQRDFFERKLTETQAAAIKEAEECKAIAKEKTEQAQKLKAELRTVSKDKSNNEKKLNQTNQKLAKVLKELETEKQLNKSLRENKKDIVTKSVEMEGTIADKDAKITELQSQLTDIMAHLEAMNAIQSNPELQGGQLQLPEQKKQNGARRKSRK